MCTAALVCVKADIYLLDIRAFLEDKERGRLKEEAFSKLDEERRKKAERIGREKGVAESLGAGLLLQLAVQRAEALRAREPVEREVITRAGESAGGNGGVRTLEHAGFVDGDVERLVVPELLKELDTPLALAYWHGENGKPYLKDYPYYFNLSHSGDYVACALSKREVGIDIQKYRTVNLERLAGRYFPPAETEALLQAEDREAFFFRLWARKEAYGKLIGRGIGEALGRNLWSGGTENGERLCWQEYEEPSGYSMAMCQFAEM